MNPLMLLNDLNEDTLPYKPWGEPRVYDWIAFTPSPYLHESGYNCFILVGGFNSDTKQPELITQSADHLWLDSIAAPIAVMAKINMDCFGKWVRIFNKAYKIKAGADLSSLDLTWVS